MALQRGNEILCFDNKTKSHDLINTLHLSADAWPTTVFVSVLIKLIFIHNTVDFFNIASLITASLTEITSLTQEITYLYRTGNLSDPRSRRIECTMAKKQRNLFKVRFNIGFAFLSKKVIFFWKTFEIISVYNTTDQRIIHPFPMFSRRIHFKKSSF